MRCNQHIPTAGAAIIACNHLSFVDAVLPMAANPRPIRFVMVHRILAVPMFGWLFNVAKAIPIATRKESPEIHVYAAAFEEADRVPADGDLLGIFPVGATTRNGARQLI